MHHGERFNSITQAVGTVAAVLSGVLLAAPAVWFVYSPNRKGEHPQTHLADFHGVLQADAFAGFNAGYDTGRVREARCWAHARRQFHDLHAARPIALTTEALRRIGELYAVEELIRGKPPDERRAARQLQAKPLLDDLARWLQAMLATLSRKRCSISASRRSRVVQAIWTHRNISLASLPASI